MLPTLPDGVPDTPANRIIAEQIAKRPDSIPLWRDAQGSIHECVAPSLLVLDPMPLVELMAAYVIRERAAKRQEKSNKYIDPLDTTK